MALSVEERLARLERAIFQEVELVEDVLEELETPLPVTGYPQTAAILVA